MRASTAELRMGTGTPTRPPFPITVTDANEPKAGTSEAAVGENGLTEPPDRRPWRNRMTGGADADAFVVSGDTLDLEIDDVVTDYSDVDGHVLD